MPRSKSVLKRERQNETRRQRNQSVRSGLKTLQKKARTAVAAGGSDSAEAVKQAQRRLAKAATKGVIHKNKAARTTSRLAKAAAKKPA